MKAINNKKIILFIIVCFLTYLLLALKKEINEGFMLYNNHMGYFFTDSFHQIKNYYPRFFIFIFVFTRIFKYGVPLIILLYLYKERQKIYLYTYRKLTFEKEEIWWLNLIFYSLLNICFAFLFIKVLNVDLLSVIKLCSIWQLLIFIVLTKWEHIKNHLKYYLISLLLLLFTLEIGLRIIKLQPGKVHFNRWFRRVDNLKLLNGFKTNAEGIYIIDSRYVNFLNSIVKEDSKIIMILDSLKKENINSEFRSIIRDFNDLQYKNQLKSNFEKKIYYLNKQLEYNEKDSLLLYYSTHPFNMDGFFSIPFVPIKSDKPSVLMLGDSFTWGHDTNNKTNSFVNELLAKGYVIYNTGISGVDVAQYEAVAKKYIPLLKPNIVILNFFLGNDVQYTKRIVDAEHPPVFFATNAGNLMSVYDTIQFITAKDAYENMLNQSYIIPQNFTQKIIVKSSVLTQIWIVFNNFKMPTTVYGSFKELKRLTKPSCNEEINNIKEICKKYNSKFELLVIPDFMYKNNDVKDFPYLFENIDYIMSPVGKENYNLSNGHFNDEGHYEYAMFLDSLIINDFK